MSIHYFDYYGFILCLEIRYYTFFNFLLFQKCDGFLVFLNSCIKFRIYLIISSKDYWDFKRDFMEFIDQSGENHHLTILSLPIHENEISFHYFRSSYFPSSMFCNIQFAIIFFFHYK